MATRKFCSRCKKERPVCRFHRQRKYNNYFYTTVGWKCLPCGFVFDEIEELPDEEAAGVEWVRRNLR